MKAKNLILLTALLVMGSQSISPQTKGGGLPVFDFTKDYPQKKMLLQDITDIEYIPLETSDDILLGRPICTFCRYRQIYSLTRVYTG